MIKTTYILSANSSKATIFSKRNDESSLKVVEYFECPDCKLRNIDLVSDRPGRLIQKSSKRTKGLSQPQSPKERAIERFAKTISQYLDKARKENQFDELIIVASPKFLGVLRNKFSIETTKIISRNINKDLSQVKGLSILQKLA